MGTISENIIYEIKKVICGKDYIIAQALTAILAGGHILMEDVPGVGKTTMAVAFSKTMGLNYGRVQFTPDVLPSDITGFNMYDEASGAMVRSRRSLKPWRKAMSLLTAIHICSRSLLPLSPHRTLPAHRERHSCRIRRSTDS